MLKRNKYSHEMIFFSLDNIDGSVLDIVRSGISELEILRMDLDKQHMLFGGTRVVRAHDTTSGSSNDVPLCVALRTGFSTAKEQSVRLILFQNHRPQFKLYEHSFIFIGILALMALLDFIIIVIMQALFGIDTWEIILRADIQQQSLFLQIYQQI
ncbi:MAG: hypothetical protein EZS28_033778 [Streblomastix strix]|uniref:Uncharacterized protein n=1 Tax=Streblomastix strix TaxID=222440 RepID=A0A5J4ULV4_9EUKA|nr:MAG: hypothetical protein EZS28_033778 [Streblomastix strix]